MTHEDTLEFTTILQQLADCALSEAARARCLALRPAQRVAEAARHMADTTQARRVLEQAGTPPLAAMQDLDKVLTHVEIGAMLVPEQLLAVSGFLVTCRRMKAYLKRAESTGAELAFYGASLYDLTALEDEIARCIRNGQVDDEASRELASVRRSMLRIGEQIKAKLDGLLRKNSAWFSENFVAQRGGRYTLPVKSAHRNDVPGTLVERSGSGGTCFIEPASVRKLQDELNELRVEEDAQVRRVLYTLTAQVGEQLSPIRRNIEAMETLDFLFAKGKLSVAQRAAPVRVTADRDIRILCARHPLLPQDSAVPLDFALGERYAGVVVTGPNTGGKTVALKTVGLLALMAQSGLHVPADPSSSFCMLRQVLCDIGDGQSITENLSTFSSHITNILRILQQADAHALVLLDELGSGTDPAEGMGIAVAILDALRETGCLFVATTHYPEIKEYAASTPGLINARMAFDRESLLPLYRLELGEAGESCALYIAERLGMPPRMLARAQAAIHGAAPGGAAHATSPPPRGVPHRVEARPETAEAAPPPVPHSQRFQVGDSVTVYPAREIGIVYARANDKGEVGVQVKGQKRLVPHKRLKLKVAAEALYPEDYDLATVLDSVANRKARHLMNKRHVAGNTIVIEEGKPDAHH